MWDAPGPNAHSAFFMVEEECREEREREREMTETDRGGRNNQEGLFFLYCESARATDWPGMVPGSTIPVPVPVTTSTVDWYQY